MNPWPPVPCDTCAETGCGSRLVTNENAYAYPDYDVGMVAYSESSSYFWHTAGWDRTTGAWHASCCRGHVHRGYTAPTSVDVALVPADVGMANREELLASIRRTKWPK